MAKKKTDKIRVVTYIRVSTKSEAQKTSVDNQPLHFSRLLKNKDISKKYELKKTYVDRDSGTKLSRLNFDKMLEDAGLRFEIADAEDIPDPKNPKNMIKQKAYNFFAKANYEAKFDEIWVKSTSRWARNIKAIDIIEALLRKGINLFILDYGLNSNNESDLSRIKTLIQADEEYSRALSRNISASKELIREQGIVNSNKKLFGYTYHERTKDKSPYLTINEEEAQIVRKIFELSALDMKTDGIEYGSRRLCNHLVEHGMFNRAGKKFYPTTIRKMLDNEKYMGFHNPGKYTTGSVFNKYSSNRIRDDYRDFLIETDDVPKIVEPTLWYKCQDKKKDRYIDNPNDNTKDSRGKVGNNFSQNKYAHLLRCQICNNNFRFDNNRGNPFYTCSTKERDGIKECNVNNVYLSQLNAYIDTLKNGEYNELFKLDIEKNLNTLISIIEEQLEKLQNPALVEDIDKIKNKIEVQKQEITEIYRQLRRPNALKKILQQDLDDLEIEIKTNESKLQDLSATPDEIIPKLDEIFTTSNTVISIYNNLQETYTEEEILERLERIEVYGVKLTKTEIMTEIYGINLDNEDKTNKAKLIKNFKNIDTPKPGLLPIFKKSTKLNRLINLNLPSYDYTIRDGIGDNDELLDKEVLNFEDLKYNKFKVTLDHNIKNNAFNLETGYIKDLGVVDSPNVIEQIIQKLESLKLDAAEISKKYISMK